MQPSPNSDPRRSPRPAPVARISRGTALIRAGAISLVAVVLLFSALTIQMALGNDPALGSTVGQTESGSATVVASTSDSESDDQGGLAPLAESLANQVLPSAPAPVPAPAPVQTSTS